MRDLHTTHTHTHTPWWWRRKYHMCKYVCVCLSACIYICEIYKEKNYSVYNFNRLRLNWNVFIYFFTTGFCENERIRVHGTLYTVPAYLSGPYACCAECVCLCANCWKLMYMENARKYDDVKIKYIARVRHESASVWFVLAHTHAIQN